MKKRIAKVCALALIGAMTLTACGKSEDNGKTEDGKTKFVLQHGMLLMILIISKNL